MAITDQQYQDWLRGDNGLRVVLVEVEAYSGGAVTRAMSNVPFVSEPGDTPANTIYDDIVLSVPQYKSVMGEQVTGKTLPSYGEVIVDNSNGVRDGWLADAWDGRPVRVYLGAVGWSKADFRLILSGVVDDIVARSADQLTLRIRDRQHLLNGPLQTALIGGSSANADKPKPVCYGECYNVEPLLIDAATRQYQVHDGQIDAISAVYDNGVSVGYSANLANGTFTLSSAATGRITADVRGSKSSGSYINTVGRIIERLLLDRAGMTAADIDAASVTAFDTACPQAVGFYAGQRRNLLDALDELIRSVGGWYSFGRDGKLRLGRLDAPSGTPVLSLTDDDVAEGKLACKSRALPVAVYRLGYRRNWTVLADGGAASVATARREELKTEYLTAKAVNSGLTPMFANPLEPDQQPSLLVAQADAAAEATRRAALYSQLRYRYELECTTAPQQLELGQVIRLTHPRFGFAAGQLAVIVGITERPTDNIVTLEIWR